MKSKKSNYKHTRKPIKLDEKNNITYIMDGESEYIRYATISMLTEKDRKKYNNENMAKGKRLCKICGIEYYINISATCPLCEMKKVFLDTLAKKQFNNDEMVNANVDSVAKGNGENDNLVEKKFQKTHNYKYGDIVKFGRYDGKPIEWIVIRVEENKIMLLSKDGLCSKAYHSKSGAVTWETSSLRKYLNSEFIEMCLNKNEQQIVLQTHIENRNNTSYNTAGGNDTNDKIFLLSMDEVKKVFNSNKARVCVAADNAKPNGAYVDINTGNSWWWLRSPGMKDIYAAYVENDGVISESGNYTGSTRGNVRPALWINGNKLDDISIKKNVFTTACGVESTDKHIITYKKGDIINFGNCEGQPIEWIVLKVEINKVLLLSKSILDLVPYNISKTAITWKYCSLRHYMNWTFIEKCFSVEEKELIVPVAVKNKGSNRYNISGGEDTIDKVFCLSINELSEMFINDYTELQALPTNWTRRKAVNQGVQYEFCDGRNGCGNWWLRSSGYDSHSAAYVDKKGVINEVGRMVNTDRVGVRPVLWMRIE